MYYQKENFNGTYDFRCRAHDGFIIESHIHEYSEILYCQKGECDIMINGENVHVGTREFVFIPPHYIHRYSLMTDVHVICAVFSNDFIPLFFQASKGRKPAVCALAADELAHIFESFPHIDKSGSLLIMGYLNLICNKVIEQGHFEKSSLADGVLYRNVISYVSENFTGDISLKKLASIFGYNPKYLSGALHALTGMHFSDFTAMYRVEYAKELLTKNGALSVTDIAEKCGFTALNTFNRRFKKLTGMTPTQYRKLYVPMGY